MHWIWKKWTLSSDKETPLRFWKSFFCEDMEKNFYKHSAAEWKKGLSIM